MISTISSQPMPILATYNPVGGIKIKASALNDNLGEQFKTHIVEQKDPRFVYAIARAVTADVPNKNHDMFPLEEIKRAYTTFIGRNIFLDHNTKSVRNAVGKIIAAELREDEAGQTYVACLFKVDRELHPDIARKIENGIIDSVSMGANVKEAECSKCHHRASREADFCEHMKSMYMYPDMYSINHGVEFTELSLVSVPADPTAHMHKVFNVTTGMNKTADSGEAPATDLAPAAGGEDKTYMDDVPLTEAKNTVTQPVTTPVDTVMISSDSKEAEDMDKLYQIDCSSNETADLIYNILYPHLNQGINELTITGRGIKIEFSKDVKDVEKFVGDVVSMFGLMMGKGLVTKHTADLFNDYLQKTAGREVVFSNEEKDIPEIGKLNVKIVGKSQDKAIDIRLSAVGDVELPEEYIQKAELYIAKNLKGVDGLVPVVNKKNKITYVLNTDVTDFNKHVKDNLISKVAESVNKSLTDFNANDYEIPVSSGSIELKNKTDESDVFTVNKVSDEKKAQELAKQLESFKLSFPVYDDDDGDNPLDMDTVIPRLKSFFKKNNQLSNFLSGKYEQAIKDSFGNEKGEEIINILNSELSGKKTEDKKQEEPVKEEKQEEVTPVEDKEEEKQQTPEEQQADEEVKEEPKDETEPVKEPVIETKPTVEKPVEEPETKPATTVEDVKNIPAKEINVEDIKTKFPNEWRAAELIAIRLSDPTVSIERKRELYNKYISNVHPSVRKAFETANPKAFVDKKDKLSPEEFLKSEEERKKKQEQADKAGKENMENAEKRMKDAADSWSEVFDDPNESLQNKQEALRKYLELPAIFRRAYKSYFPNAFDGISTPVEAEEFLAKTAPENADTNAEETNKQDTEQQGQHATTTEKADAEAEKATENVEAVSKLSGRHLDVSFGSFLIEKIAFDDIEIMSLLSKLKSGTRNKVAESQVKKVYAFINTFFNPSDPESSKIPLNFTIKDTKTQTEYLITCKKDGSNNYSTSGLSKDPKVESVELTGESSLASAVIETLARLDQSFKQNTSDEEKPQEETQQEPDQNEQETTNSEPQKEERATIFKEKQQ